MAASLQRCAALAAVPAVLAILFMARATAQSGGQTESRLQIAGTPVTLVPMTEMAGDGRPSITLTSRNDGPYLWAFGLTSQDYDDKAQRARGLAERHRAIFREWRAGTTNRMLSQQRLDHGIAVEYDYQLIVRDGPLAALVVVRVPVAAAAGDPGLDAKVLAMLDTVALTNKVLTPLESFEITPPSGFTVVGTRSGGMRELKDGHGGGLWAKRLIPSTEADPERTERSAKVAHQQLESEFIDVRIVQESLRISDAKWTYSERIFEAVTREGGRRVQGIERDQTNLTNDRFVAFAFSTTGWSESQETAARRAFESIWIGR